MIDYIFGARGSGKTAKLIKLSASNNIPIVTSGKTSVKYIKDLAVQMGVEIPEPYTIAEVRAGRVMGRDHAKILLDNAEPVIEESLEEYLRIPVGALALTVET